jgi:glycerophosphoryl diester phosphodiesterase
MEGGTMEGHPDRHPYFDGPYPRAYAHRGWHTDELAGLENTLAAFHRAVKEGFGYLELDVHATADGAVVVHHDATLDRTTDGHGLIGELPAAEVAAVQVLGARLDGLPRAVEPIPLLADVLAELPGTRLTIEIKSGSVVAPLLELIERTDSWDRVCLGSYDQRWLARARAAGGRRLCTSMALRDALRLRTRAWVDALPGPLRHLPVPPAHGQLAQLPRRLGPLTVVDRGLLERAHATGREVHVWTVDDPAEMAELLDLGVDGLLSDRPDLLRDLLQERGQWPGQ